MSFFFQRRPGHCGRYWGDAWEDQEGLVLPLDHRGFLRNCGSIMRPGLSLRPRRPQARGAPGGAGEEDLLWIRGDFITSMEDFGKKVIFGHTPFASR